MWPFSGRRQDVQSLYTEGLDHLLRGNLQQAFACFKGVVEQDTDHTAAYLKLGQVMRQGGAYDRALKLHESLLARPSLTNYERVELFKHLALDHLELDQLDRAIERALAVLKLDKRDTWALRHLVKFCRKQGDWEAAGKYLAQWQKATNNEDLQLQAWCRFRQGYDRREIDSPDNVREHFQQALKIDDTFAPAHYFLAASYADEAAARRSKLTSLGGNGGNKPSRARTDEQDEVAQLYWQALSHWASFVELAPAETSTVLPQVEDTLFYLQRFDDVEPFLRQVLDKDPDNLDGVASLANFYVRKGELDRAEQLLGTIREGGADSPLINAIALKLNYRRNANQNLLPQLDKLVDAIRMSTSANSGRRDAEPSPMSWLEPDRDPLEHLE